MDSMHGGGEKFYQTLLRKHKGKGQIGCEGVD
jgi:hypothetical protein